MSALIQSLFRYKAWANAELFAALKVLDPIQYPDELHSAIRILNHIYVVDRIFIANLQQTTHGYTGTNTSDTPTLEDLHQAVTETDGWYIAYVDNISPEGLGESIRFSFVDGDLGHMTREEMLAHIVTHGGYHRGAVGRILAQLSIAPPRDIYSKFLHDTELHRRKDD